MTTLQEAAQKAIELFDAQWQCSRLFSLEEVQDVAEELRSALAQQGEPVAYITETEQGPMVWTPEMYDEACTYCDDGEFPVPLYTVTALRSQVEYLEKIVEDHAKALAQQGEPVAWAIYDKRGGSKSIHWAEQHTDGNAEMYNAVPLYAGVAPAPVEQRCTYCDGTGDVHSIDGEWRGTCHCAAAPAPQPAQGGQHE